MPIASCATSCWRRSGRVFPPRPPAVMNEPHQCCENNAVPVGSAPFPCILEPTFIPHRRDMIGRPKFVLASGSPRRLALINQAGIEPDALKPVNIDETPKRGELPRAYAHRLAHAKAYAALEAVKLDDELRGSFIF